MGLPSPTFSLSIPSLYDGIQLDCRLFHPKQPGSQYHTKRSVKKGAIVAHPYAPLGGCSDDPVVGSIASELLQLGYIVSIFNFRGAGDSEGRTSWTAKPEVGDYISVYGYMLEYLRRLEVGPFAQEADEHNDGSTLTTSVVTAGKSEESPSVKLLLGGYSYGSMIASHLPKVEDVWNLFENPGNSSPANAISLKAKELSEVWNREHLSETRPGYISATSKKTIPEISYLLVSPILPPVSLFVTMFSKISFISGPNPGISIQGAHIPTPSPDEQLCTHPSLVIYGTKDMFTSLKKIQKWVDTLRGVPQCQLDSREIDGAGHFWVESGTEPQLRQALREWLCHTQY